MSTERQLNVLIQRRQLIEQQIAKAKGTQIFQLKQQALTVEDKILSLLDAQKKANEKASFGTTQTFAGAVEKGAVAAFSAEVRQTRSLDSVEKNTAENNLLTQEQILQGQKVISLLDKSSDQTTTVSIRP
jgi:hypothetical protein